MYNYFEELSKDIDNINLPENLDNLNKINGIITPGKRFYWYYKEDMEQAQEDGLDVRELRLYSGVCVSRPAIESKRFELDAEDTIVVCDTQPCEKSYPIVEWITLGRLLDQDDLVEFHCEEIPF